MTQLEDTRPHVFKETDADSDGRHPAVILGALVTQLLEANPDVDLPTIRLWLHQADGVRTLRVDARRGQLAGIECPQCHQPAGRPHTDYCTLAPRQVWDGVLPARTEDVRACRICGCTDDDGCAPACWWAEADLCSACQ